MDLVHEKDVVLVEVRQQRRQVPGFLNGRAGGDAHIDPHLVGDDAGEGGLAQARRAVEQDVVQRLRAHFRRLDEDLQVPLGLLLPDVLPEGLRAQGVLPLVLTGQRRGDKGLLGLDVFGKIDAHGVPFFCERMLGSAQTRQGFALDPPPLKRRAKLLFCASRLRIQPGIISHQQAGSPPSPHSSRYRRGPPGSPASGRTRKRPGRR